MMKYLAAILLFTSSCTAALEARVAALEESHTALELAFAETRNDVRFRQAKVTHDLNALTELWESFREGYSPELTQRLAHNVAAVRDLLEASNQAVERADELQREMEALAHHGRALVAEIDSHERAARVNEVIRALQQTHRDFLARAEQIHRDSERAQAAAHTAQQRADTAEDHARDARNDSVAKMIELERHSAQLEVELTALQRAQENQEQAFERLRRELERQRRQ